MKILITGYKGYIGNHLFNYLSHSHDVVGIGREVDLLDFDIAKNYFSENDFDVIIHCAIEGGSRLEVDTYDITNRNLRLYKNIRMNYNGYIINMASGAEFDVRNDIKEFSEDMVSESIPVDPYGISKNMIARLNRYKGANLRIFNVFAGDEKTTRFIRSNITRYINREPMIIHQDRWFDFFYITDLFKVVDFVIQNIRSYDLNMVYDVKYKLSDICNIINKLDDYSVPIEIQSNVLGNSYTGSHDRLYKTTKLDFIGLEAAIKIMHEYIKL